MSLTILATMGASPGLGWRGATILHPFFAQAADGGGFNLVATFERAELAGKIIVGLLLVFSLLGWTVMIAKHLDLSNWRRQNHAFLSRIKQTTNLLSVTVTSATRAGGPNARLFHDAVKAANQQRAEANPSVRMGLIENALQRGVAEECVRYEEKMVVLGSLVSGAPFIGLLGTVWGVMVAFSGMSQGNTTLQNLAPGVASALLATVAGLLVAIPSVFGYNFLLTRVKTMITELENFASWLADALELELESRKSSALPQGPVSTATTPPPSAEAPIDPAAANLERYLRFDVSEEDRAGS